MENLNGKGIGELKLHEDAEELISSLSVTSVEKCAVFLNKGI